MVEEPILDVAHLAHLELLTPTPEKSLDFFVDVMGMTESGRSGDSVYLRGWDDYERYSLKLTAIERPRAWAMPRSARAARRRCKAAWRRSKRPAPGLDGSRTNSATGPPISFAIPTGIFSRSIMKRNGTRRPQRSSRRSRTRRNAFPLAAST